MSLYEQIDADIKKAMLAKDKIRLQALRGIKKEFIEGKTAPGSNGELTEDAAMKILVKMAKQRRESAQIYTEQNRPDLAEGELAELAVIEEYLPKPLTDEELTAALTEIIIKALARRADGKAISAKVRELLNK